MTKGAPTPEAAVHRPPSAGVARRYAQTRGDWFGQRRYDSIHELCHDLRHPVAVIAAVVAAIEVDAAVPPALRARLGQIAAETQTISELCRQVLDEHSRQSAVRVDALTSEVVEGSRLTCTTTITMRSVPAVARGDHTALRRAVWNLVGNATSAAGATGHVAVDVENLAHEVVVAVADSGPGFGRTRTGLAGVGLDIAYRVAAHHGGRIAIGRSERLGGAAVSIILPRPAHDLDV